MVRTWGLCTGLPGQGTRVTHVWRGFTAVLAGFVVAAGPGPAYGTPGDVVAVAFDSSTTGSYNPSSALVSDASRGQNVVVDRLRTNGVAVRTPTDFQLVAGDADLAVGEWDLGTGPGKVRFSKYPEDCDNQTGHLSIRDFAATNDAIQRMDATLQVTCSYVRFTAEIRWHVDNPYRAARATGQFRLPDGALGQDRSAPLNLYSTGTLPATFGTPRFAGLDAADFSISTRSHCTGYRP